MTEFQAGWYRVQRKLDNTLDCRFFDTPQTYIAHCWLEANGSLRLWWDARKTPPAKTMTWEPRFQRIADSPSVASWDTYACTIGNPRMEPPIPLARLGRKRTIMEELARGMKADFTGPECVQEIHVGVFFDGTNNNMLRDRPNSHSNIVSLYDAHLDDRKTHFAYYLPGVGTPFKEIGELTESSEGKSFAMGGEARIHWAMLNLYNAIHRSFYKSDLLQESEMKTLVTKDLSTYFRHATEEKEARRIFLSINQRLMKAMQYERPRIIQLHLSVFGFSRGAAEARVFCNWIQDICGGVIGEAKVNIRFLGIFDTVASVGIADSSPIGRGFLDWAHNNLAIKGVEKTVHYVAGHEIRRSFPLSTVRDGGSWPANTREYVYPGTHSDIGGGYGPGEQGKSLGGRSTLMSQITLNDMYEEAFTAGVRLIHRSQMDERAEKDFAIDPAMHAAFMAYTDWTLEASEQKENLAGSRRGVVESRMHTQMQHYWRWRASKQTEAQFKAMHSWANASPQDQQDLWEAELDWRTDVERARKAHQPIVEERYMPGVGMTSQPKPGIPSQTQSDLLRIVNSNAPIPPLVDEFFDRYVHDSHAGFWLLGPLTQWDKKVFVNEIRKKKGAYDQLMALSRSTKINAHQYVLAANRYALNHFEQRVYDASNPKAEPGAAPVIPLMTDADAPDLRDNMGFGGLVVEHGMGSGTRREANGSGQYRRIFDQDHEVLSVIDEAGAHLGRLAEGIQEHATQVADSVGALKDKAMDSVSDLPARAAEVARQRAAQVLKNQLPKGLPPMR